MPKWNIEQHNQCCNISFVRNRVSLQMTPLHRDFKKTRKIEMKGSLTLPSIVLQALLKGKMPAKYLLKEALASIEEVAEQLKQS